MARGRPREFDADQVLRKAMELFWARGYEGASTTDLLQHTGIARQSLYRTFGDKRSLFLKAVRLYGRSWMGEVRRYLDSDGSALEKIEWLLDRWERAAAQEISNGCLMVNTTAEFGVSDLEIADILREEFKGVEEALERALERARADGEIPADTNCRAMARTLNCLGQGVTLLGRLSPGPEYARDVLQTTRLLLRPPSANRPSPPPNKITASGAFPAGAVSTGTL